MKILLAAVSLVTLAAAALAEPPVGVDTESPMAQWYRSLTAPNGISCCSMADCRPIEARLAGDRWEVFRNEKWEPVPEDRILKRENPDGRPIACIYAGQILCFVPPASA